ncbi:hypothetical protein F4677DRAFT_421915 [Hypoxylon crocopeplum]|nr:hypothetical protein F4677DRAFT_421915 [Hypoxylon crocopeplum]
MRSLALQASPTAAVNDEKPFICEYRTLWCSFPRLGDSHGLPGQGSASNATDHSLQYLVGHERSWIFIYERLPAPTRERTTYTQDDVVAFAERWGDLCVGSERLKVRDVFAQRYHAGMANLEEGVLEHWSWGGRLVLAGDAAHKFTPNQGLGFNNGIQDVVALTNELHRALQQQQQEDRYHDHEDAKDAGMQGLDVHEIAAAFERYQSSRLQGARDELTLSARVTHMSAWRTSFHWFFDWWVQPYFPDWLHVWLGNWMVAQRVSKGLVLDFVEGEELFVGSIPWVHPVKRRVAPASTKS